MTGVGGIMDKKIRKAVRTILIKENKIVVTKYKTKENNAYYDIPGGKIEQNESSIEASIREFKEETGIDIINQKYKGNVIIEYPTIRFDLDIYMVSEYNGYPLEFEENYAMWIDIEKVLNENKKLPSVEIIRYINLNDIKLKIFADENHNVLKVEE